MIYNVKANLINAHKIGYSVGVLESIKTDFKLNSRQFCELLGAISILNGLDREINGTKENGVHSG